MILNIAIFALCCTWWWLVGRFAYLQLFCWPMGSACRPGLFKSERESRERRNAQRWVLLILIGVNTAWIVAAVSLKS